MTPADLLIDAFGRIRDLSHRVLDGLDEDALTHRPEPDANTIGWLVWHQLRVQDDHIADVAGTEQVWMAQGFVERFALPYDATATGYGQTPADVGAFAATADLLADYADAVTEATRRLPEGRRRRRPGPGRRHVVGPAGHPRRPAGQRGQRRPPAPGPGGVREGLAGRLTTADAGPRGGPAPREWLGQTWAALRRWTAIQTSRAMTAPMIEPMMPAGWRKPSSESLWKSR